MAIYDVNGDVIESGGGGSSGYAIETYYESEMEDTIAKVREAITEPSLVFPVVTDIHRYIASVQTFDKMIANIAVFSEAVKCDFIANLGDTLEGNVEQQISLEYADEAIESFHRIGVPFLYIQGNHDNNPYTTDGNNFSGRDFSMSQVFRAWFTATKGVADYNESENGTDYYLDFDSLGIRVVCLNACNVKLAHNYAYGNTTATWLTNALNTDKTVLLLQHLSSLANQVGRNKHGTNADAVTNALQSFINNGGKLLQINGHNHLDITYVEPWPEVQMACQKFSHADVTTSTIIQTITGYVDIFSPERAANTFTEDLWTVCVMKPQSGEIACIRFGAGRDRYLHYVPIAPTTLTSKLSGVTWSSSNQSIATVANGVVTGVGSGTCGIIARDVSGNFECWTVKVAEQT